MTTTRHALLMLAVSAVVVTPAYAAGDQFTFSGGGSRSASVGFGVDSCTYLFADLYISRSGTHNLSAPSTTGFAEVDVFMINNCTNTFTFELGYTTNVQLAAPGAPNTIPQSLKASGTMTAFCSSCTGKTDTFNFMLDVQTIRGTTFRELRDGKFTQGGVTSTEHLAVAKAFATGSVSVTSAAFGTLPVTWRTNTVDENEHGVTFNY